MEDKEATIVAIEQLIKETKFDQVTGRLRHLIDVVKKFRGGFEDLETKFGCYAIRDAIEADLLSLSTLRSELEGFRDNLGVKKKQQVVMSYTVSSSEEEELSTAIGAARRKCSDEQRENETSTRRRASAELSAIATSPLSPESSGDLKTFIPNRCTCKSIVIPTDPKKAREQLDQCLAQQKEQEEVEKERKKAREERIAYQAQGKIDRKPEFEVARKREVRKEVGEKEDERSALTSSRFCDNEENMPTFTSPTMEKVKKEAEKEDPKTKLIVRLKEKRLDDTDWRSETKKEKDVLSMTFIKTVTGDDFAQIVKREGVTPSLTPQEKEKQEERVDVDALYSEQLKAHGVTSFDYDATVQDSLKKLNEARKGYKKWMEGRKTDESEEELRDRLVKVIEREGSNFVNLFLEAHFERDLNLSIPFDEFFMDMEDEEKVGALERVYAEHYSDFLVKYYRSTFPKLKPIEIATTLARMRCDFGEDVIGDLV
jgi:hypothetical protein